MRHLLNMPRCHCTMPQCPSIHHDKVIYSFPPINTHALGTSPVPLLQCTTVPSCHACNASAFILPHDSHMTTERLPPAHAPRSTAAADAAMRPCPRLLCTDPGPMTGLRRQSPPGKGGRAAAASRAARCCCRHSLHPHWRSRGSGHPHEKKTAVQQVLIS